MRPFVRPWADFSLGLGVAFFATQHNGGNKTLVALGGIAAKIVLGLGFQKGDNIIDTLESGSTLTETLQD